MDSPVILAVDEDPDALRNIDQELNDRFRYGSGKRVACRWRACRRDPAAARLVRL
jgi:hypothetical protein